jgi:formate dehydrogenase major subunit
MTSNGNGHAKEAGRPVSLFGKLARHVGVVPDRTTSARTERIRPRIEGAQVTKGICPYCAVGCAQTIYHRDGQILSIEGDYDSPINQGTLCPKGANIFQIERNPHRVKHAMYRAPYSQQWKIVPLDWAMDQIAQRVKKTRDEGYQEKSKFSNGQYVNAVLNMGMLGGATLDNEENYLMKKLMGAGLQVVSIENQARI